MRRRGAKVTAIACDVADPAQCATLVARTVDGFGTLDISVNNAGIGFMMKPLMEVDPADWATVMAVNLSGAFYCTQAAAGAMIAGGRGGRIVNIASQAAKTAFPHLSIRNYGDESNYLYGIKAGAPRTVGVLRTHEVTAS